MKTAFIFPGQGAQYVGMAQDYIAAKPEFAKVLKDFDAAHGTQLEVIMREGPEDRLKETSMTQPAILFHSICALKCFNEVCKLKPDFVAGHSLGEFSALVANGSLSWQDALHLVHKRGEFMIKANQGKPFAMAAVIGLNSKSVIEVCHEAEGAGLVRAVNFNTPIQTVISGSAQGVETASALAKEHGAKRVIPLVVGGPFHTPMIDLASVWLREEMGKVNFKDGQIPLVSNLDSRPATSGEESKAKLMRQVVSPVLWVQSVQYMIEQGVRRFIEFGPQKVLSGMIKNIDKDIEILNMDKLEELDALQGLLC